MDNNVFIDKETYKIYEDYPKAFNCDKKIAKTISTLNQKGYITKSSCEGHIEFGWNEIDNCDIDLLEDAKNNDSYIILNQRDNSFDYLTRNEITSIYISFKENYNFKDIPDGFLEETDNGYILRKTIYYFDNNVRKNREELEREKDKYLKVLENWAMKLPVNERNDLNE